MTPTLTGPIVMPASGNDPQQLVILIHGYGSNGDDLIGIVQHWQSALPDTVFLAPNGPVPCPGVPGGFQWWALATRSTAERAAGARLAAPVLGNFIDEQITRFHLTANKLALVGFGQGTMMGLHVGPRCERQIAGIVGYSGGIADPEGLTKNLRSKPPVLLIHGDVDDILPIAGFHQAKVALDQLGFDLTTHVSRGLGHGIDEAGLTLGEGFLHKVLTGTK
jgi:phospholipase/carboxylesterase